MADSEIDLSSEVLRAAASVAWLAEEAARRVEGSSFVHDQARSWNNGVIDDVAVVGNALVALEEAVDRLNAYMPSLGISAEAALDVSAALDDPGKDADPDPDPVRFTGSEGWDFAPWIATKVGPLVSATRTSRRMWQTLLQDGPTFFDDELQKTFEVRPEIIGSLQTVAQYAARISEVLIDGRVRGSLMAGDT